MTATAERTNVPRGVEIIVQGRTANNNTWAYVLGYKSELQLTLLAAQQIANEAVGSLLPQIARSMSNQYYITSVTVADTLVPRQIALEANNFIPIQGLVANPSQASNVASVISWRSGMSGRSKRGRTYLTGISEASATGDVLEPAQYVEETITADAIKTFGQGVLGLTKAVISYKVGIAYPIVSYVIDLILDSQRRRLQGRGE